MLPVMLRATKSLTTQSRMTSTWGNFWLVPMITLWCWRNSGLSHFPCFYGLLSDLFGLFCSPAYFVMKVVFGFTELVPNTQWVCSVCLKEERACRWLERSTPPTLMHLILHLLTRQVILPTYMWCTSHTVIVRMRGEHAEPARAKQMK